MTSPKSASTNKSRQSLLVALMCCAMLLLALFVARWLQTEYASEKEALNKELVEEFMASRDQVMDTVLTRSFIEPLLNNPDGFKLTHVENDTVTTGDSVTVIARAVNSDTIIHITSLCDTCSPFANENFNLADSNNQLIRGVKLFISEVKGERGSRDFFNQHVEWKDTTLLQTFFKQHVTEKGLPIDISWTSDTTEFTFPPPPFIYESRMFDRPYQAKVSGYGNVILTIMLPQFLFAGLLLSIVCISFLFAYRSLKRQRQLAQLKDDLISNISHELKTPVATMKVAIEAMQDMDPAEKQEKIKNYLRMAGEEVVRLDTLVNKVMQSVIGDGAQDFFHASLLDANGIALGLSSFTANKDVTLTIKTPESPSFIMGDAFHLKSALQNLLENAVKYGGKEISLQVASSMNMIAIEVSDDGPGIPEAYHEKIFDKFFRIPTGNVHQVKGYGLGLHYVKQVVEAAGGAISVRNNNASGCTFTISIPRADGVN